MSTFKQQVNDWQQQLEINAQGENTRYQIDQVDSIREPLYKSGESLKRRLAEAEALREGISDQSDVQLCWSEETQEQRQRALACLQVFRARWDALGADSRQQDAFGDVRSCLEALVTRVDSEVRECWLSWKQQQQQAWALEETVLEGVRAIPGQESLTDDYLAARNRFSALSRQIPAEAETVRQLTRLTDQMVELRGQMDLSTTPDDVSAFLDALNQGKAPLKLVTPEVLEWLSQRSLLDRYEVERSRKLAWQK